MAETPDIKTLIGANVEIIRAQQSQSRADAARDRQERAHRLPLQVLQQQVSAIVQEMAHETIEVLIAGGKVRDSGRLELDPKKTIRAPKQFSALPYPLLRKLTTRTVTFREDNGDGYSTRRKEVMHTLYELRLGTAAQIYQLHKPDVEDGFHGWEFLIAEARPDQVAPAEVLDRSLPLPQQPLIESYKAHLAAIAASIITNTVAPKPLIIYDGKISRG